MNAQREPKKQDVYNSGMKKPLIYSVGLHILVVVLATMSLPFFIREPEIKEMAITVELAELSDISQAPVVAAPNESKEETPEPPKPVEQKPVYKEPEPEPTPEPAPDLLTPKAPEVEEVPEPPEEKPPEEEKVEEVKKPPPPKPMNKPKPPKPKVEKPKEEPKKEEKPKEPEKDFSSLLKSLTPDQQEAKPPVQAPDQNTEQSQTSQLSQQGATLTRSEEDELNRGVQPCWNVNAGGKNAQDLMVTLRVFVSPDMRVSNVEIVDQSRYGSDPHFRTAAEAARRALLNPNCNTLKLPPEKYEQWKVFKYNFDPSAML